jgi:hypothetical protein
MEPGQIYEIIGYIASALIAISLMMRSILRLRVINLIGALFFTGYGWLIAAYPVAFVNFIIVLIDLYYLGQMLSTREFFRLLEVEPDSDYLREFLDFYREDIHRFQPDQAFERTPDHLVFFVLRNMVPAGLVIGAPDPGGEPGRLLLQLDYAIPGYRDLKIGRFVFQTHAADFLARGIHTICSRPGAPAHIRYLRQMGFAPEQGDTGASLYGLKLRQ